MKKSKENANSEYKLNIIIDEKDVAKLKNYKITLSKANNVNILRSTGEICALDKKLDIAWVTSEAWQNIEVIWENKFQIYASDTKLENGAVIKTVGNTIAENSKYEYAFKNRIFNKSEREDYDIDDPSYYYANKYQDDLVIGLAQTVTLGSKTILSPINAVSTLKSSTGTFTPVEIVKIYLCDNSNDGKVISTSTTKSLYVDLTNKTVKTVKFNSSENIFEEVIDKE